ncbi:unnamed protein product [Haemonchus placei]|uniref:Uncharacterized protein n=1 Tax=Haemonchus placei TaxID=6290 RepID=A0A0N4VUM2_HAEPC|nr:unnamed protein product [Haemonchus placei]
MSCSEAAEDVCQINACLHRVCSGDVGQAISDVVQKRLRSKIVFLF